MPVTYQIAISSAATGQAAGNFNSQLNPPVVLDPNKEWTVCLFSASLWNTSDNISKALGNNTINANVSTNANPGTVVALPVVLPDAGYAVTDVANYFNSYLTQQGYNSSPTNAAGGANANYAYFGPFLTTGTTLYLGGNYQVDFTNTPGIADLLGFSPILYSVPAGKTSYVYNSPNQANVAVVSTMSITFLNLINPNFSYSTNVSGYLTPSNSIYTLAFSNLFGYQQTFIPYNLLRLPVQNKCITSLNCQILDQNGKIIDFGQDGDWENNPAQLVLMFESVDSRK